jgi:hypothetical protein
MMMVAIAMVMMKLNGFKPDVIFLMCFREKVLSNLERQAG